MTVCLFRFVCILMSLCVSVSFFAPLMIDSSSRGSPLDSYLRLMYELRVVNLRTDFSTILRTEHSEPVQKTICIFAYLLLFLALIIDPQNFLALPCSRYRTVGYV